MVNATGIRHPRKIRIALAGFGTVGRASLRLLQERRLEFVRRYGLELTIAAVFDRSHQSKDTDWVEGDVLWTDSAEEFLATAADVVVEVLGGSEPADRIIRESLSSGIAVVTANKLLVAEHGAEYVDLAFQSGAFLGFEAAVAGGIPIVRILQQSLAADSIEQVRGILNGTCNFILSEMAESRLRQSEILAEAQALGYAESNPEMDLSGHDTRDKLAILAALAFGQWVSPESIPTKGIQEIELVDLLYAERLDSTIRLLGTGLMTDGCVRLRVSPYVVNRSLPLAHVSGVLNAIETLGRRGGSFLFSGPGAGGDPTAVSITADILQAVRVDSAGGSWNSPFLRARAQSAEAKPASEPDDAVPFYLRFTVRDEPGIIASLARILASRNINIDSVLQKPWDDKSNLPFIITVEPTPFAAMERAAAEMASFDFNRKPPLLLPILN